MLFRSGYGHSHVLAVCKTAFVRHVLAVDYPCVLWRRHYEHLLGSSVFIGVGYDVGRSGENRRGKHVAKNVLHQLPIKIELLELATIDAKNRAKAMLKATGDNVGQIKSVKMGVFQITPINSTNVSDIGISDTSTIEKKITAVANAVFKVN